MGDGRAVPIAMLRPAAVSLPQSCITSVRTVRFMRVGTHMRNFVRRMLISRNRLMGGKRPVFHLGSRGCVRMLGTTRTGCGRARTRLRVTGCRARHIRHLISGRVVSSVHLSRIEHRQRITQVGIRRTHTRVRQTRVRCDCAAVATPFANCMSHVPCGIKDLIGPRDLLAAIDSVSRVFTCCGIGRDRCLHLGHTRLDKRGLRRLSGIRLVLPSNSICSRGKGRRAIRKSFRQKANSVTFHMHFPGPSKLLGRKMAKGMHVVARVRSICVVPRGSAFRVRSFACICLFGRRKGIRIHDFGPVRHFRGCCIARSFPTNAAVICRNMRLIGSNVRVGTSAVPFRSIEGRLGLGVLREWKPVFGLFVHHPVLSTIVSIVVIYLKKLTLMSLPVARFPSVMPPSMAIAAHCAKTDTSIVTGAMTAPLRHTVGNMPNVACVAAMYAGSNVSLAAICFGIKASPSMTTMGIRGHIAAMLSRLPRRMVHTNIIARGRIGDVLVCLGIFDASAARARGFICGFTSVGILHRLGHVSKIKLMRVVKDHSCTVHM